LRPARRVIRQQSPEHRQDEYGVSFLKQFLELIHQPSDPLSDVVLMRPDDMIDGKTPRIGQPRVA
jgi:hypothetical protein